MGFAGNSLLCRLALAKNEIDPAGFTGVRLVSGALVLSLIARGRPRRAATGGGWTSAAALFAYAALFSYAYLRIGAGVGALALFCAVQATMLGTAIARGERPRPAVWVGLALALGGLAALAAPGASAPDPVAVGVMALAGAAWAVYTLRGREGGDPLVTTADNFARTVPFVVALVAVSAGGLHVSPRGFALATVSGAAASGVAYALWYAALGGLTTAQAAIVQLLVPVLAAAAGCMLLGEQLTPRLVLAGAAILTGVALAVRSRR